MNGVQHNYEKPGCLGRVANLFDLNSGVPRRKLLTEKPHCDGVNLSRSRSDVSMISSSIATELEDKVIVSETNRSSSTRLLEGIPVKMLIAHEMSKDLESRHDSPNVVAKLMGLDVSPNLQEIPDFAHNRRNSKFHLRESYSEIPVGCWHEEDDFFDRKIECEIRQCDEQQKCKDRHEMWQSPPKTNFLRDVSLQKGRCNDNTNEQPMDVIRKKFIDAKRLSTDEKLRQTKQFRDALDVLSSNQGLFLKVLREPNSLISHQLYGGEPIPLPTETKRITVLKPSKMAFNDKFPASGNRCEKQGNKSCLRNRYGHSPVAATRRADESHTQPTRIVVLKPTPGRIEDVMEAVPSTPASPRILDPTNLFGEPGDVDTREAREVAKEITQQMRENLAKHRRDETILSSVLSNGYTGDESSFRKSEAEFVCNQSDSEVMSPAYKHSWDYINRNGSPFCSSSFSRASYSPESSVAKEAKKRLSERWAMMASNGTCVGEPRHVRRSPSTLGEMLALSDINKPEIDGNQRDQDHRVSTSCLISNTEGVEIESPRSLLRSKSLPVSSTGSHQEAFDREAHKMDGPNKKAPKSSFRGKVTSLFFQRSKKPCKGKTNKSQLQDQAIPNHAETTVTGKMPYDYKSECRGSEEVQSSDLRSANRTLWLELNDGPRLLFQQMPWSTLKPAPHGTSTESQDQPSPISVLERPFDEDGSNTMFFSESLIQNHLDNTGKQPVFSLERSNLIDKSPPIGSIARILSWDESSAQPATSDSLKSPFLLGVQEEGDWLFLVQSLLSLAGVENESRLLANLTRWHSLESPLDPLLREKYVEMTAKEPFYEANRRQLRSNCYLVFDCVNSVLVDLTGMGSKRLEAMLFPGDLLVDRVWAQMKHWFSGGGWEAGDDCENTNLVAEKVVRKELAGRGWEELVMLEIDIIGKEIEGKLLEELVEETLLIL